MPNIGQLSYSVFPAQATPGQIYDLTVNHLASAPANEQLYPGRLLQIATDGVALQQVQNTSGDTTTPPPAVGIAILKTAREGFGAQNVVNPANGGVYSAGDTVPYMFRGTMFGEWKGTTQTAFGSVNVYHSSTIATDRGKFTDAAAASGAGVEISPAGAYVRTRNKLPGSGTIVLLDVNMPGKAV